MDLRAMWAVHQPSHLMDGPMEKRNMFCACIFFLVHLFSSGLEIFPDGRLFHAKERMFEGANPKAFVAWDYIGHSLLNCSPSEEVPGFPYNKSNVFIVVP